LLIHVINQLGDLHEVYLIGDLGRGHWKRTNWLGFCWKYWQRLFKSIDNKSGKTYK
jgi:hypothetical protein